MQIVWECVSQTNNLNLQWAEPHLPVAHRENTHSLVSVLSDLPPLPARSSFCRFFFLFNSLLLSQTQPSCYKLFQNAQAWNRRRLLPHLTGFDPNLSSCHCPSTHVHRLFVNSVLFPFLLFTDPSSLPDSYSGICLQSNYAFSFPSHLVSLLFFWINRSASSLHRSRWIHLGVGVNE